MTNRIEIGMETITPPAQKIEKYLLIMDLPSMLNSPSATVLSAEIPELSISFASTKSPHGTRKELMTV